VDGNALHLQQSLYIIAIQTAIVAFNSLPSQLLSLTSSTHLNVTRRIATKNYLFRATSA